jgi:hypothetical protein
MSNVTQESAAFERLADTDPARNPQLVMLNCAQGGQAANVIQNPNAQYWTLVQARVAAMGLTNEQVQVAWLKQSITGEPPEAFPDHAIELQGYLHAIVRNLRDIFPNLRLAYMSSRIYAGYGGREPRAYETGFAFKWVIEEQIDGDPALNWDPGAGPVESPLLLWGPYLWANGAMPNSQGTTWLLDDFEGDRVHPGPSAEAKVAGLLHTFFTTDPSAEPWYFGRGFRSVAIVEANADAHVESTLPNTNFGTSETLDVSEAPGATSHAYTRFDVRPYPSAFELVKLNYRMDTSAGASDHLVWTTGDLWTEAGAGGITWNNAPGPLLQIASPPRMSRDGTSSADVTGTVTSDVDGVVSFVRTTDGNGNGTLEARESSQSPRLVITLDTPGVPYCFCGDAAPCGNPGGSGEGCANSTGNGARLASTGRASVAVDTLRLRATQLPPGAVALLVAGDIQDAGEPFADGLLCVGGSIQRLGTQAASVSGIATFGPGLQAIGGWTQRQTRFFQVCYPDAGGPCGQLTNTTNGVRVTYAP